MNFPERGKNILWLLKTYFNCQMYLTNITVFLLGSDKGHKFYMKMEKKEKKQILKE